jgi:branched-chain amino acid transport system permease protein
MPAVHMTEFLTQSIHGLTLGALFALVAVGYTMVFGIIKLINFAHGEFYMAGGFAGMLFLLYLARPGGVLEGWPGEAKLVVALLTAGLFVACLAVFVEHFAYKPIRGAGRICALLTAVGVSLFLQNTGIAIFDAKQRPFPETVENEEYPRWKVQLESLKEGQIADHTIKYRAPMRDFDGNIVLDKKGNPAMITTTTLVEAGQQIKSGDIEDAISAKPDEVYAYPAVTVTKKQLIVFFGLIFSAGLLYFIVQKTRIGRAMRAVSHNMAAASLMGINPERIVLITFSLGGLFAGVGGVLAGGMFVSTVDPMMGFMFGLKAFIAAVLGGIGNILGAMLGGLALGLIEQYAQHYANDLLFRGASSYRDAIAFVILIVVLLIKPTGFLGRIEGEKV